MEVTVGDGSGVSDGKGNGEGMEVWEGSTDGDAVDTREGLDEQAAKRIIAKKMMTF